MLALKVFTHYTIKQSFNQPETLVARAKELGYTHLGICDRNSLSGCVEFYKECKKHKIVPILGTTIQIKDGNIISIFAENKNGWNNLVKIIGRTQMVGEDIVVDIADLKAYSQDIVAIMDFPDENLPVSQIGYVCNPTLYTNKADYLFQQILLCSYHNITLKEWDTIDDKYPNLMDNNLEYNAIIDHSLDKDIESLFESYDIAEKPRLPKVPSVNDPDETLRGLCREGWKRRKLNTLTKEMQSVYVDRIKMELDVFREAKIASYFLILQDFIGHGRSKNQQIGLRGSAGGCLVSYLIGLDNMDPIIPDPTMPYDFTRSLLFERFYNKWRNTENNISLPDVDVDMPNSFRQEAIEYVENRYGSDRVGHIITFGRFDGRGAIKEVFRILGQGASSFEIANMITREMVDTAKIQDVLEELRQDDPNYSVIQYCIDHLPKVKSFYDEYKQEFDIAIHMSSVIFSQGKHAAGIVISDDPLYDVAATCIDPKTNKRLVALEMADAEYCGVVKYDFLGVAALEKIGKIAEMINLEFSSPRMNNTHINYGEFDDN